MVLIGPKGTLGTITVGTTTTVDTSAAAVTNSGTPEDAILDFDLPKGEKGTSGAAVDKGEIGPAGTVAVGVVRSVPQSLVAVTNTGTPEQSVLDFDVPKGSKGEQGLPGTATAKGDTGSKGDIGTAATIAAGTVTTVTLGNESVSNSGTSSAAVFDFDIPVVPGDKGQKGARGTDGNNAFTETYATWDGQAGAGYTFNSSDTKFIHNVANITRQSQGVYTITFSNSYSSADYHVQMFASRNAITQSNVSYWGEIVSKTTSSIQIRIMAANHNQTSGSFTADTDHINIMCLGD